MNTWILQMGYPVITANITEDGQLHVTQKHFLSNPDQTVTRESPFRSVKSTRPFVTSNRTQTPAQTLVFYLFHSYVWTVPLSFVSSDNPAIDLDNLNVMWLESEEGST